jgi:hypothetical protein
MHLTKKLRVSVLVHLAVSVLNNWFRYESPYKSKRVGSVGQVGFSRVRSANSHSLVGDIMFFLYYYFIRINEIRRKLPSIQKACIKH